MIEKGTQHEQKYIELIADNYAAAINYINSIENRTFTEIKPISAYKFNELRATFLSEKDSSTKSH